jgi:hypothetical protein
VAPTMTTLSAAETPLNISRAGSSQDLRTIGHTGVEDDRVETQPLNGGGSYSGDSGSRNHVCRVMLT